MVRRRRGLDEVSTVDDPAHMIQIHRDRPMPVDEGAAAYGPPTTRDCVPRCNNGHPNRGLRDFSSTMARMSASSGPFGPGLLGHGVDENRRRYFRRTIA